MNYYLWIEGQEQGPYTLEQIHAAASSGHLSQRQTARREDSTEWKPLVLLFSHPAEWLGFTAVVRPFFLFHYGTAVRI